MSWVQGTSESGERRKEGDDEEGEADDEDEDCAATAATTSESSEDDGIMFIFSGKRGDCDDGSESSGTDARFQEEAQPPAESVEEVSPASPPVDTQQSGSGNGSEPVQEPPREDMSSPKVDWKRPAEVPQKRILESREIYILMSKEYRISRNRRAEWFFSNVNTCLDYPPEQEDYDFSKEKEETCRRKKMSATDSTSNGSTDFEVVSIIPLDPPSDWTYEERHSYRYHVNPDTTITYLSRRYRIVFCLDISPSAASVDVQAGGVVFDNTFKALQASLNGLLQPYLIPGSRRSFRPEIFLTVIAHTPFFTPVTDQVLIQGQVLEKETCASILRHIFDRLNFIENKIARLVRKRVHQLHCDSQIHSSVCWDESDDDTDVVDGALPPPLTSYREKVAHRSGTGGSSQDENPDAITRLTNSKYASFAMSPDFGLLDLLRQALIALSLMPENSSAGLVILTDGVISVPDGRYLDIILSQLRYNTVSCSFIQLSSPFHPHLCHGVIPYADLMKFIASATFGAFLNEAPEIVEKPNAGMNVYHNAFLAWSFHKTLEVEWNRRGPPAKIKPGEWSVRNKCFFSVRDMPIVKKQQYENILHVDHMKVMSCRLREGFTIKEVVTSPETGLSEVTLILPWKFLIHLEYKIMMNGDDYLYGDPDMEELDESGYPSKVKCIVSLEGPYDFLHDVTCLAKKPFPSLYRQLMVNRFWATRKNLSESDRLLVHLNSFSKNPAYYTIPETVRNGMPLFYWGAATNTATPQLHSNELSCPQFTHFWKPVCLLDTTVWQKWMHTHRIGVILEHDYPLPKNLHLPNSTGRFNVIQCRQAVMALNTLLRNMSSFVLVENQSYVHLMYRSEEEKVPHSFCLIRVTSKPPHVVLRLAFLVGTPGHLRHRTVAHFREKITALTFPQRVKDPPNWRVIDNTPVLTKAATTASPLVNKTSWNEMPCCAIVHKPVEKILIRYDKCPDDFRHRLLSKEEANLYVPEGKSAPTRPSTFGFRPTYQSNTPVGGSSIQMLPEVFNTIARYLHHRRWVWWFPGGELPPLNVKWASEILATVTKMRLQEGFRFAYSSAGITNMVLELPMRNESSTKKTVTPMVVQFLVFPPMSSLHSEHETLDDDSVDSQASSLYLVTECWVEPQCGRVTGDCCGSDMEDALVPCKNMLGLDYSAIPKLLFETDQKCISLVGTFEYLVRICGHKDTPFLVHIRQAMSDKPVMEENETIDVIPFELDLRQILMRSLHVEVLVSSFFQDLSLTFPTEWNVSVCSFFERANSVLYQQWCGNISAFQDKEVYLTTEQHEVATISVIQRKGFEEVLEEHVTLPKEKLFSKKNPTIQWRCFVRSSSSTHVLLTLVPATLKDLKTLLLQMDTSLESLYKTKSSHYVDLLEHNCSSSVATVVNSSGVDGVECPNQHGSGPAVPVTTTPSSGSSPQLADHHRINCLNCQNVMVTSRKRIRAFSGGSECAPASKKYLPAADEKETDEKGEEDEPLLEPDSPSVRSQTFSEGTVSGKLAQFMRAKRTLSDQSAEGSSGMEPEQDKICSDPQRCTQLNDYLNRMGIGTATIGGPVDDAGKTFVPCRAPFVASIAFCLFTYSCSLMSLSEHVIFRKTSTEEMSKDFRLNRDGTTRGEFGDSGEDDDDDMSTGSGSFFSNGRSISQDSFSETSLQRMEAAEHDALLKTHCALLRQAHLQAFIGSAYRSLLSGYSVNPSDIQAVIDRSALTRVHFPLDKFLEHVCKYGKDGVSELRRKIEEGEGENESEQSPCKCNAELVAVHKFIQRRFRRLMSRNFSNATENGNVLFYKIAGSSALSDVSGFGGPVKCNSDVEENLDSCSVIADSLCSGDEPYQPSSLCNLPENDERSTLPSRSQQGGQSVSAAGPLFQMEPCGGANQAPTVDDNQSCGGFTATSLPTSVSLSVQCSPLFCYLSCNLQVEVKKDDTESECFEISDDSDYIPLVDIPTCYRSLCEEHLGLLDSQRAQEPRFVDPSGRVKLRMVLTFLTSPENRERLATELTPTTSPTDKREDKLELTMTEFKKRLSVRQNRALEQMIADIEWLIEDEITSFRGGGGGMQSGAEPVSQFVLENIGRHIERSQEKPGCTFQQIQLNFVEHSDEKGFQSFLERFNNITVDDYGFRQEGIWWYLVMAPKKDKNESESNNPTTSASVNLPPFWILVKAYSSSLLRIYHHCRYDENNLATLTFSRNIRVRIVDLIANLIRTINQDLLLQQLHDARICSPLLEVEDPQDLDEVSMDMLMIQLLPGGSGSKFGSESDISSTLPLTGAGVFCPGMFSCQVVWVTTFTLHSRLRSGGGTTAFSRGIQTLRSTLTAFEVANRKNMFVYRDAGGNVFYMRFYRGVDVLENACGSPSKVLMLEGGTPVDDCPESEIMSLASDSSSVNRILLRRTRNQDSESEKGRDNLCDRILALKVHGIVPAGEEIKEKLVQSLRNKLDDAVIDILSVTLKRNPHCKLTPEDVHFLQEPRTKPDMVFRFKLTKFIVEGHLPAFAYYLHQNLLQFLSIPKYTSQKIKHHFQDYSRLQLQTEEGTSSDQSSVYLYNQSPGGGGTGNRGIAIVSMALTDEIGNSVSNPDWKQPEEQETECFSDVEQLRKLTETEEVVAGIEAEASSMINVEFNMWKQGRINFELLRGHVAQSIKQAEWDLIMEFKVMTAPLSSLTEQQQPEGKDEEEEGTFDGFLEGDDINSYNREERIAAVVEKGLERKRRSSYLNPATRSNSTGGALEDDDDEPRTRSMSFNAGLRKAVKGDTSQGQDRAPSPITLTAGRGGSEGSRPRSLLSRSPLLSLTRLEKGETGRLHHNYTCLFDSWLERGSALGVPSVRKICIPLNCHYPVRSMVQELERILGQVAPDNITRQFWKHNCGDYLSSSGHSVEFGGIGDSCLDESSLSVGEHHVVRNHERDLARLEGTEEAEYPPKLLSVFLRNENFQPSYDGQICFLVARNLTHWKCCVSGGKEEEVTSVHTSPEFFKNLYKYPPLLHDADIDGSRGSIEKLPRPNFPREFVLWNGTSAEKKGNTPILIPRQRFLRAEVTNQEVTFVVYNWSKECCERLQEQVTHLSYWIQARASLLSSLLLQKTGLVYCQPILPDNFASPSLHQNPFVGGTEAVDIKDLILNPHPIGTNRQDRRNPGANRLRPTLPPQKSAATTAEQQWADFYRNTSLCHLMGMPSNPTGDNPVDTHGRQLLHVINARAQCKEPDNTFLQYWLTRGPSASNVITTQMLDSFKRTARTIHFCLTPIMFLPLWRSAVAQTRDNSAAGGIITRRHRRSNRKLHSLHPPPSVKTVGPSLPSRVRHGSEASQGSAFSLRNRSRSYHSGMMNAGMYSETISEIDFEGGQSQSEISGLIAPHHQQQQSLFLKVKLDEPWHGVLCRTILQEYMQYLQTLGFVPVHCKPTTGTTPARTVAAGQPQSPNGKRIGGIVSFSSSPGSSEKSKHQIVSSGDGGKLLSHVSGMQIPTPGQPESEGDDWEVDERLIHFLQRCLPGGIIVIEVGLSPPFLYCKIHALEAKRIFPSRNGKGSTQQNSTTAQKNGVQFADECEKMKIMTHLHSFMYDFHLRAMYLYISGRQLLFKNGYHITTFLDDFITYYPKCPNYSRNAVHIGEVTLAEVSTPAQVLFNYILSHDKQYRMKVIRMTPGAIEDASSSEYVLVHNMSRKVSYRTSERVGSDETEVSRSPHQTQSQNQGQHQSQDEFDLTLVVAHDYPTASLHFIPDYQGLKVKYYIVLTSRRELYPKGDVGVGSSTDPTPSGKFIHVNTPEALCARQRHNCSSGSCFGNSDILGKLIPPPAPPPSYFEGFEGHVSSGGLGSRGNFGREQGFSDVIREEKVYYMGYFSSHEQFMQKVIDEQKDTMEQFIKQIIIKAAVDCRRDLLWQRLLIGRHPEQVGKGGKGKGKVTNLTSLQSLQEDIISRETMGPLYYSDFNELLDLVQVVPLRKIDPRLEELIEQPVGFYQNLVKVLSNSGGSAVALPYSYREFSSGDGQVHRLAIFTPEAQKAVVMVEVRLSGGGQSDIYALFKDGKKGERQDRNVIGTGASPQSELCDAFFSLVERVVNACCYTTWTSLL